MEKYKCEVPVLIKIWTRLRQQKEQFEIIKKVKPYILFLVSDGGRNDEEWENINKNRKMILDGIDWDCHIYRLFEDDNLGLYTMDKKAVQYVWSKVDRCILLEDDIIPSESFFYFCEDVLERYINDTRVSYVTGTNLKGIYEDVQADYFFCPGGSISGIASWKRVYDTFYQFPYKDDSYVFNLLLKQIPYTRTGLKKQVIDFALKEYSGQYPAGDEFFYGLSRFGQNQLCITPKKNLVRNAGDNKESAHYDEKKYLPKAIQRTVGMQTYEIEFPMKHPQYVIPDFGYADYLDKVFGRAPIRQVFRKAEHIARVVILGGPLEVIYRIKRKKNRIKKER